MAETKKQHYVPRCYLKNFADKKDRFYVFDKDKLEKRRSNVNNVGMENYFYELNIDELVNKGDPEKANELKQDILKRTEYEVWEDAVPQINKSIETNFYGPIEGEFSAWIKDMINKYSCNSNYLEESPKFSEKEKIQASFFCAIQLMRTKLFREQHSFLWKQFLQFIVYHYGDNDTDKQEIETTDEFKKLMHISAITDPNFIIEVTKSLYDKFLIVYINKAREPFYTSDNPVNIIPKNKLDWGNDSYGFESDDVEIVFPISPYLLISFDGRKIDPKYHDGTCIPIEKVIDIDYMNLAQIFNSDRCIFSNREKFEINGVSFEKVQELKGLRDNRIQKQNNSDNK